MSTISRRELVSGLVTGGLVLGASQIIDAQEQTEPDRELEKYPISVDAAGKAVKALPAARFLGTDVVSFYFSPGGGADWHQPPPKDLSTPAGAQYATICLAGWQLRVNKSGLHDIGWHDGGVIVWLHSPRQASCRVLLRDDTGDEPFNGFVRALISFYG